jgi:NTP pyrophosphatase (non-canonical NTP hydrolase)
MDRLDAVLHQILVFRKARDWAQFHTPRNLAAAVAVEAAEIQEIMLWRTDVEVSKMLSEPGRKAELSAEIADVLIFALLLCHESDIDPIDAIQAKLAQNAIKYPKELARGTALKYTQLRPTGNSE